MKKYLKSTSSVSLLIVTAFVAFLSSCDYKFLEDIYVDVPMPEPITSGIEILTYTNGERLLFTCKEDILFHIPEKKPMDLLDVKFTIAGSSFHAGSSILIPASYLSYIPEGNHEMGLTIQHKTNSGSVVDQLAGETLTTTYQIPVTVDRTYSNHLFPKYELTKERKLILSWTLPNSVPFQVERYIIEEWKDLRYTLHTVDKPTDVNFEVPDYVGEGALYSIHALVKSAAGRTSQIKIGSVDVPRFLNITYTDKTKDSVTVSFETFKESAIKIISLENSSQKYDVLDYRIRLPLGLFADKSQYRIETYTQSSEGSRLDIADTITLPSRGFLLKEFENTQAADIHPGINRVALVKNHYNMQLYELDTQRLLAATYNHLFRLGKVKFSHDGRYIAVYGDWVVVLDGATLAQKFLISERASGDVFFTDKNELAVINNVDAVSADMKVYSCEDGSIIASTKFAVPPPDCSFALTKNMTYVVIAGQQSKTNTIALKNYKTNVTKSVSGIGRKVVINPLNQEEVFVYDHGFNRAMGDNYVDVVNIAKWEVVRQHSVGSGAAIISHIDPRQGAIVSSDRGKIFISAPGESTETVELPIKNGARFWIAGEWILGDNGELFNYKN